MSLVFCILLFREEIKLGGQLIIILIEPGMGRLLKGKNCREHKGSITEYSILQEALDDG
jgi:hypothetical protein